MMQHRSQYMTLAQITCNYLIIQGSVMPSESVFFSGDMTGTAWCNQSNPMAFGSLQLLKSAYLEMVHDQAKVENFFAEQIFKNDAH